MSGRPHKQYPGLLGKRCAPQPILIPTPESEKRLLIHQVIGMVLLLDHYEVPAGDFTKQLTTLVYSLAKDHVPYFLPPNRPGAKIDVYNYLSLLLDVEQARKPGDRGNTPAMKRLLARDDYKHYALAKGGEETLRKRYQRARKDPYVSYLFKKAQIPGNSREQILANLSRPGRIS